VPRALSGFGFSHLGSTHFSVHTPWYIPYTSHTDYMNQVYQICGHIQASLREPSPASTTDSTSQTPTASTS
jgi:hypothetical protein